MLISKTGNALKCILMLMSETDIMLKCILMLMSGGQISVELYIDIIFRWTVEVLKCILMLIFRETDEMLKESTLHLVLRLRGGCSLSLSFFLVSCGHISFPTLTISVLCLNQNCSK